MVRRQGLIALLFLISCKPAATPPTKPAPAPQGPQTRATVVTIETTIQPGNKTTSHTLVIGNGRARSGDELDSWRLFDLANDRVTFVNDVERTFRTVPRAQLEKDRRGALDDPLPDSLPRAQFAATNATKAIQGVAAKQSVVRLGGYTHELWIGQHPLIPPKLYALIVASEPPSSPLVPVMKNVDEALLKVSGFPLAEHSELTYGNKKMTVDKQVTKIEQRDVPAGLLNIRTDYKDVTKPVASPRPAS
ncbi:MAG TPA: hypothetical protein VJZ76_21505 [Thermoanaerobaculia bacterium]|nr:hypothetical protein [Thermoanaerobaculia bacterium]